MNPSDKTISPKSAEQFFADMYRDLRTWNREIPESPERADPILRILLQLFSNQLASISQRIDLTWDQATRALIKAMAPEAQHWPVPAFTIMSCEPADPVVEIDGHTKFFFKEKREGGQTFFFSSHRTEKLMAATVSHILLRQGDSLVDLGKLPEASSAGGDPKVKSDEAAGQLYMAVTFDGPPSDFQDVVLYLKGADEMLRQIRWGTWYPGTQAAGFDATASFCPGLTSTVEGMFTENEDEPFDWGGFRTSADLYVDMENNWIRLPGQFSTAMEKGFSDHELSQLVSSSGFELSELAASYFWIRIDLPPGGDKRQLRSNLKMLFNCFVVTNRNELTLFKHTGGNKLVEVELSEPIETILEIVSVVDSQAVDYQPRYKLQAGSQTHSYTLEERNGRLVLWFDFSHATGYPPDSLTVTYATTAGVAANGIAAGSITELYENHPGVVSASNVASVRGAVPAKTEEQVVAEVSERLRSRDRALTFAEIATWAKTFDPRVKRATCRNGVQRTGHGVRRCVVVELLVGLKEMYSEDESALLGRRLERFLKSRAPVNTHFSVEITAK